MTVDAKSKQRPKEEIPEEVAVMTAGLFHKEFEMDWPGYKRVPMTIAGEDCFNARWIASRDIEANEITHAAVFLAGKCLGTAAIVNPTLIAKGHIIELTKWRVNIPATPSAALTWKAWGKSRPPRWMFWK